MHRYARRDIQRERGIGARARYAHDWGRVLHALTRTNHWKAGGAKATATRIRYHEWTRILEPSSASRPCLTEPQQELTARLVRRKERLDAQLLEGDVDGRAE